MCLINNGLNLVMLKYWLTAPQILSRKAPRTMAGAAGVSPASYHRGVDQLIHFPSVPEKIIAEPAPRSQSLVHADVTKMIEICHDMSF